MERKLDNKMKRELSYVATLNDRNISLVSIRKQQAARDVPELLIIGEKSKTASPVKASSNLQKEEKLLQSYSMGMTEINTVERQVSEHWCVCVCVCMYMLGGKWCFWTGEFKTKHVGHGLYIKGG